MLFSRVEGNAAESIADKEKAGQWSSMIYSRSRVRGRDPRPGGFSSPSGGSVQSGAPIAKLLLRY